MGGKKRMHFAHAKLFHGNLPWELGSLSWNTEKGLTLIGNIIVTYCKREILLQK